MEHSPSRFDVDRRAGEEFSVTPVTPTLDSAPELTGPRASAAANAEWPHREIVQGTGDVTESFFQPSTPQLSTSSFHRASAIAAHLGVSVKTIHRRAEKEAWPALFNGNRREYTPPFELRTPNSELRTPNSELRTPNSELPVTYLALSLTSEARARVLQRERAVKHFNELIANGTPRERAHVATVSASVALDEPFLFSVSALRRWVGAYGTLGVNGLVEQKQGNVGRKPAARFLSDEQKSRLQAQSIEHGSMARAGRLLMRDPELHAAVRQHLHGAHPSKSYLPPSIREAAFTTPMTAALHTGPHAARMMTSSVHAIAPKPGEVYVADDETPNIYCWEPWPNKLGYILRRPQILQIADCGSLMPIAVRVVLRHTGAYTADDVAGLLGDACDDPGLPKLGFLLEGGAWQSNKVIGHRTNLSVEERIGGIAALGLEVFHAHTPSAKWQIEGQFHLQQHIMDNCPGYCGRNERTDLPEKTKKLKALAECGKIHPSEFLLSLSQFTDRVMDALREYSHECQDGKTLRGESPFEKWNNEKPALRKLAEKDKWLYRSAMSVVTVKRNGELRISHGSGRNQRLFYYTNPPLLMPRAGAEVAVFWNDHNPESDCVIMAGRATNPKQRICIGVAKYAREISRFDSTKGELGDAMKRKAAELLYAKTELRTLAPHLERTSIPVTADATARQMGSQIADARARSDEKQRVKEQTRRAVATAVSNAAVTVEDLRSVLGSEDRAPQSDDISADEISALFESERTNETHNHLEEL